MWQMRGEPWSRPELLGVVESGRRRELATKGEDRLQGECGTRVEECTGKGEREESQVQVLNASVGQSWDPLS